jgi:CRP-like cAMP-binding protein
MSLNYPFIEFVLFKPHNYSIKVNVPSLTWVNKVMKFSDLFREHGTVEHYKKGQHIFKQGDKNENLYFIQSGFLKAYYLSSEGKEQVKSFISPNSVMGSLLSCYANGVCSFSLASLEPATVIKLPFNYLLQQSQQNLSLANQLQNLLLELAMKKEKREYEFLCLPAEQRYLQLQNDTPGLFTKATQNDIAHYLGITNVALSRIKKRVNANNSQL